MDILHTRSEVHHGVVRPFRPERGIPIVREEFRKGHSFIQGFVPVIPINTLLTFSPENIIGMLTLMLSHFLPYLHRPLEQHTVFHRFCTAESGSL
jgi:hypothetical protein